MLRWCYICKEFYGEKPPYENKQVTSGICPKCWPSELEKLDKIRRERAAQKMKDQE